MAAAEAGVPAELPRDLVFVDLETTGGNAALDRITEVGVVRLRDGVLVEEWSSLVNPECPIPPYIEAFTGISNAMVADAPRFADIAAVVRKKLGTGLFVAHNARFDYAFLRSEFLQLRMSFTAEVLCTVKLSRRLFPEFVRHNLDAVMERNGLRCDARHRALGDAKVLHDFWLKLRGDVGEARLAGAVQSCISALRLPAHLPAGLVDDLPEGAGVYRFFGEEDVLLYVGKGDSLRTRICAHFSAQKTSARDRALADQVRRIDWQETYGELGAMLCEAAWLKAQNPLYNRHPKTVQQFYTLRPAGAGAPAGQAEVAIVAMDTVEPGELGECFGTFNSVKDARKALGDIARAHRLCLKILGLESAPGGCVAHALGKCKGACLGTEPVLLHRVRAQLALTPLKLKSWPFRGRIAVREREPRRGFLSGTQASRLHVFDRWAYLGTASSEQELGDLSLAPRATGFDAGVYRFLLRFFTNNPRLDWLDLDHAEVNAIS